MKIFEIPGKLVVTWNAEVKAVVDTWANYLISDDEFREAVLIKGVSHAKRNRAIAWIVDSSFAKGLLTQEQIELVNREIFPAIRGAGVSYFVTIKPRTSFFTQHTVKQYSELTGPNGLILVTVDSMEDAVAFLKEKIKEEREKVAFV